MYEYIYAMHTVMFEVDDKKWAKIVNVFANSQELKILFS